MRGSTTGYCHPQRCSPFARRGDDSFGRQPPSASPTPNWKGAATFSGFLKLVFLLTIFVFAFREEALASNRRGGGFRRRGASPGRFPFFRRTPDYFPDVEDPEEKKLLNSALIALLRFGGAGSDYFDMVAGDHGILIEVSLTSVGLNWPEYEMIGELTKELRLGLEELKQKVFLEPNKRQDKLIVRDNGRTPPYRSRAVVKMSILPADRM